MAHFQDCKNLTYLNLYSTQVTGAGLAYFKNCTNLTQLLLSRTKVNDAGLVHFKDCKNLNLLDLSELSVGDAELGYFKECEHLTRLGLGRTLVTDAGLAHFKNYKKLQYVNLLGRKVGNVGLANLKECKELVGPQQPTRSMERKGRFSPIRVYRRALRTDTSTAIQSSAMRAPVIPSVEDETDAACAGRLQLPSTNQDKEKTIGLTSPHVCITVIIHLCRPARLTSR